MKKQLQKLSLSKKTVANLKSIHGGRPPHSNNECGGGSEGPLTIETACWTDSRAANSDCFCSSGDSM
ncbi:MAG: class I lanthipeptide [Bacteroidota bacterium]